MNFLQSEEWESFQKSLGRKTWRLDGALCVLHPLPLGFSYLYVPRPESAPEKIYYFLKNISPIAAEEKALFLKIDPTYQYALPKGAKTASALQPAHSLILDLTKTKKEIFDEMHQKTRYNIRLAEKREVRVIFCDKKDLALYLDIFWAMLQETAKRDGFHTHEKSYYEKLLMVRSDRFQNILCIALHKDIVVAGAIINFYEDRATYLHRASSHQYRALMAPHLLQWRIMEEAKKRDCKTYDLWGIDPVRWPGITRFKKGFGGQEILYPESFDIIYGLFWYYLRELKRKML